MKQILIDKTDKIANVILTSKVIHKIRRVAVLFALSFFIGFILLLYLYESHWIHFAWPPHIPKNYFFSIYIAFTFILFYEVLSMIFIIPHSIANSIGKQFEIMSLIILRAVFEHVGEYYHFIENFNSGHLPDNWYAIEALLIGSFGSLLLFFLIHLYYAMQKHVKICDDPTEFIGFVTIKKLIALILTLVIIALALIEIYHFFLSLFLGEIANISISHFFFKNMFSLMIFIDILLVLITMRYTSSYHVVFRTSGLMISTVIVRMSFSPSMLVAVLMTTLAVLVGIGITFVYNRFQREPY